MGSGSGRERQSLFLITAAFPFGEQETFLEAEVPHLAGAFERVVIIPEAAGGNPRPVPPNVRIEKGLADAHQRRRRLLTPLTAARNPLFWRELVGRPATVGQKSALRRLSGSAAAMRRAERWLTEFIARADVDPETDIFYSYWLASAAAALGALRIRHPGLVAVSRAHGIDLYHERHSYRYLPLQGFAVANLKRVFPVSENGAGYLRAKYPAGARTIRPARLGVRDPGWITRPSSDAILRVVSCANLYPVKRIDLLVRAIAALSRIVERPVVWNHFGDGYMRQEVEDLAGTILSSHVRFTLHGRIPNSELLEWYRRQPVDVFANVSESEGIPVSIMEAQSFGIPVVATGVGGVPEIVNAEVGALLGPDPSPEEVARSLARFAPDTEHGQVRRRSRALWEARYDAATNYSAFAQLLQREAEGREGLKVTSA